MNIPNKEDLTNKESVGYSILSFLKEDPFIRELKSDYMQKLADSGLLKSFSQTFFHQNPRTTKIVPFFMLRIFDDVSDLSNKDKNDWKVFLNFLSKTDSEILESNYQITKKIKTNDRNFDYLKHIKDEKSKALFVGNIFFDALLHSELIILSNYYQTYFNEKYNPEF